MTLPSTLIFIAIGNRSWPVASVEEASRIFMAARDRFGEGASKTPVPLIIDANGAVLAHVSYNGRVWRAGDWRYGDRPIYDPVKAS